LIFAGSAQIFDCLQSKKKERKNGDKFDSLEPNPSRGYCLIIIFITIINKK